MGKACGLRHWVWSSNVRIGKGLRQIGQPVGQRVGAPPDQADGAGGTGLWQALDGDGGRACLNPRGHLGDQGHADAGTDHLDEGREGGAFHDLTRRGAGQFAGGDGLIAEAVAFLKEEERHHGQLVKAGDGGV